MSMATENKQIIAVLSTGGTIACTHDAQGHLVPTLSGAELISQIAPQFDAAHISFQITDLARLDSSSMTLGDIDDIATATRKILQDPTISGIVITHGTDSLEETAIALDLLHDDERPIILTAAMKPADDPAADGPTNLYNACIVAMDPSARGIGVLVVVGTEVLPAFGTIKTHTTAPQAFSYRGALDNPRRATLTSPDIKFADTKVEIIPSWPGAPQDLITAALARGAQGLVIEGMGAGNVSTGLAAGIIAARKQEIPVVMTTRVAKGSVVLTYGGAGGGATLGDYGVISAGQLRAGQARIILAAAIAAGFSDTGEIAKLFVLS
ncbi:asparaginase [Corynebacterium caspium]|uniref:asparaginase n=1 Tax=Corynebacterium caspium TaxID=234828 RepID=UPI000686A260